VTEGTGSTEMTIPYALRLATAAFTVVMGLPMMAATAQPADPPILALTIDGVIDNFVADYVAEGVADAEADGSPAVLIEIDTPGGLGSAMDEISATLLSARVPVIGYVAPSGARAASAGAIVLLSCPVAAMAPATNVGAATPIGLEGGDLARKVTNDAAAQARALAERFGRDPEVAAAFVTEGASLSAEEALAAGVIDLIADSRDQLLATLDGTTVMLGTGEEVTLDLDGPVVERGIGGFVGFLHGLFDPSLAFLFFWLGLLLLILELLIPGHVFSGTIGTILLGISLWSFGLLPVRWIGIVLIVISIVAFVIEIKTPGLGIWGAMGVIALLLGGWFLYDRAGGVSVSPFVLAATAGVAALFFGVVVAKAIAIGRMPPAQGPETIIGKDGVAIGEGVGPAGGLVRVAAEEWQAVSTAGPILAGGLVRVRSIDGFVLTVEPIDPEHEVAGTSRPASEGG